VVGLGGATVPFRELLVLADVALAAGAQPVTKSGDEVVGRGRRFTCVAACASAAAAHRRVGVLWVRPRFAWAGLEVMLDDAQDTGAA